MTEPTIDRLTAVEERLAAVVAKLAGISPPSPPPAERKSLQELAKGLPPRSWGDLLQQMRDDLDFLERGGDMVRKRAAGHLQVALASFCNDWGIDMHREATEALTREFGRHD
jgi:hypothetical protein